MEEGGGAEVASRPNESTAARIFHAARIMDGGGRSFHLVMDARRREPSAKVARGTEVRDRGTK
jgi:hypothetical protein